MGTRLPILTVASALAGLAPAAGLLVPDVARAELGDPLPGLSDEERAAFEEGQEQFARIFRTTDGLGPVYNQVSCASCHGDPVPGGAGVALEDNVTRFGRRFRRGYSDLARLGGPVIQARSIASEVPEGDVARPECPDAESVPAFANIRSERLAPPLFGLGLIEAIPEEAIEANADPDDLDGDGISGRLGDNGSGRLGRFGWKADIDDIDLFTAVAFLNEMGITNPLASRENRPQGEDLPEGCDAVADPEVGAFTLDAVTAYQRFLAPPEPEPLDDEARLGLSLFSAIGCESCHLNLETGEASSEALSFQPVDLWSDLLLHDMGPELADGVVANAADGNEWRTTPLWGLGDRIFLLHDGRTTDLEEAILAHGGESQASRDAYAALSDAEKDAILAFLRSL